jgi:hypothetical protein
MAPRQFTNREWVKDFSQGMRRLSRVLTWEVSRYVLFVLFVKDL